MSGEWCRDHNKQERFEKNYLSTGHGLQERCYPQAAEDILP